MIDLAIQHITGQLNQYLKRVFNLNEDIAVASSILEQNGSPVTHIENRMVVFLINIEKGAASGCPRRGHALNGAGTVSPDPIHINLYLVCAANFGGGNYMEALKFLSQTISFFQRRPVFDHDNSPQLDKGIEKLILDIENMNLRDLSTLWSAISGKYLPSIIYRVRMLTFDAGDIVVQIPPVKEPQTSVSA